ncbi:MAG TPA: hypothetical protein VF573_01005 [Paraburkholderia sp.]|uniref:hypothetical protein n=1 Tax=Paraburkholderia sp. TaxID=1926495 RepID=UPI002ED0305E
MTNLLRYVIWIVMSVTAGWRLTYYIDDIFPGNMPYSVDMFIRFWLKVLGRNNLANPDDREVLSLLLYWALATLVAGALFFFCYVVARAFSRKRLA